MFLHHTYRGCFSDATQEGISEKDLQALSPQLNQTLRALQQHFKEETLPFLNLPSTRQDLMDVSDIVSKIQDDYTDLVILGTGGSSLGGQAFCALATTPLLRLHFMDNIDPESFRNLFATLNPTTTFFIVISKSGFTDETLVQFIVCLKRWRKTVDAHLLKNHFMVITEPKDSPLTQLAAVYHIPTLPHDPNIGGRFSALSIVGLLPAMIAGIDAFAVRKGAQQVLDRLLEAEEASKLHPAIGGALSYLMDTQKEKTSMVLFSYVDRLKPFNKWYRQLWAESLGKEGRGSTPIDAYGTVDQHSQLQLYLDGPKNKFFTVLAGEFKGAGLPLLPEFTRHDGRLEFLENMTMGDLMAAEQQATIDTLIEKGCPTRVIEIGDITPYFLGSLMMHFFLETLFAADLYGVNPFDQPAVEAGKVRAKKYMAQFFTEKPLQSLMEQ